jgi:hypothetical protein
VNRVGGVFLFRLDVRHLERLVHVLLALPDRQRERAAGAEVEGVELLAGPDDLPSDFVSRAILPFDELSVIQQVDELFRLRLGVLAARDVVEDDQDPRVAVGAQLVNHAARAHGRVAAARVGLRELDVGREAFEPLAALIERVQNLIDRRILLKLHRRCRPNRIDHRRG